MGELRLLYKNILNLGNYPGIFRKEKIAQLTLQDPTVTCKAICARTIFTVFKPCKQLRLFLVDFFSSKYKRKLHFIFGGTSQKFKPNPNQIF